MSKNSNEKESLSKKIAKYSMAASGTLLMCTQASATPQYSGIKNETITNGQFIIDMDGDQKNDFVLFHSSSNDISYNFIAPVDQSYANSNAILKGNQILPTAPVFVNAPPCLTTGQEISPTNSFLKKYNSPLNILELKKADDYPNGAGPFLGQTGFIGVRFKIGENMHYGWIQFEGPNPPTYGKVIDWGYEDQPDTPILAGAPQYNKKTATVPTLNEWGILILMALILEEGIRRSRRREKETVRS